MQPTSIGPSSSVVQERGMQKLRCLGRISTTLIITTVALFILTIVLTALAQGGYFHPIGGLCSFGSILVLVSLTVLVNTYCRRKVALKHHLSLKGYDQVYYPPHRKEDERNDSI